jgi:NADPH-dependent ferric siderophore reductase
MPKNSRRITVHPIVLRQLVVARIVDVTPGLRRVTLAGDQLRSFASANGVVQPDFQSTGFDDDVRLVFPYPGADETVLPIQDDGHLDWPTDPRPLSRVYTVRRWDPAAGEVDVDFVRHGTGIGTTWAYRAQPGDRMHVAGPAASQAMPEADWILAVGDDTALPAISRLLAELPANVRARVFVETSGADRIHSLSEREDVVVTWLVREPGDATSRLLGAVESLEWWDGTPFAWIAGEASVVKSVRRHLVGERGMPIADVEFTGYWRRGEVVTLDDDPAVPDPARNQEAFEKLHEMGELLRPLAIRAAVALGLPELIARGTETAAELAAATGSDPVALAKLLRYLDAIGIVEKTDGGGYQLTDVGDYLTEDFVVDVLHPDGFWGRREVGYLGLVESLRTGREAYSSVTGQTYDQLRTEDWYNDRLHTQVSGYARYFAEPLAKSESLAGVQRLVIRSEAAGVLAHAIADANADIRIDISGLPSHLAWARADLDASIGDPQARSRIELNERSLFEATEPADAVLLISQLNQLPADDAALVLRRASESLRSGGRVLVYDESLNGEVLDEHETENDLLSLTLHGTGVRTKAEQEAIFAAAGLAVEGVETVGWGATLYRLVPQ